MSDERQLSRLSTPVRAWQGSASHRLHDAEFSIHHGQVDLRAELMPPTPCWMTSRCVSVPISLKLRSSAPAAACSQVGVGS
jgi:hypothetical protein